MLLINIQKFIYTNFCSEWRIIPGRGVAVPNTRKTPPLIRECFSMEISWNNAE